MARARIESQSAVDLVQGSEDILDRLSLRLKSFRDNNPDMTPEMHKALSQAFVMQSKLSMKASNTLTDLDRESLLTNLAEVKTPNMSFLRVPIFRVPIFRFSAVSLISVKCPSLAFYGASML